ncbi:nucleotide-sugar transporter-domain-containing protein [Mrakia frigida]|uniref:nucleotide-sugar transporter-domain-containing protein n=1 Tax=Mrakia frigida TaxID=29902 RepID=UPI003FCC20EA
MSSVPTLFGFQLKWISLVTLTIQNASLGIIMHWSLVSSKPDQRYSAATAVLVCELLKGFISLLVALYGVLQTIPTRGGSASSSSSSSSSSIFNSETKFDVLLPPPTNQAGRPSSPPWSTTAGNHNLHLLLTLQPYSILLTSVFSRNALPLLVPAVAYVIQNNLIYLASSNLQVGSFAVLSQMKILTTAAFSVLLLNKRLIRSQWIALALLGLGVGVVQLQQTSSSSSSSSSPSTGGNPVKGFFAILAACFTSGLAGVWFEKVLKGSSTDLWIRNVQLSLFSLPPALLPVLFHDHSSPRRAGSSISYGGGGAGGGTEMHFFTNFNGWTWATILIQVLGGLLTALVIKFADNILKGFATSLSVLIAFVAGVVIFGYVTTPGFVLGGVMVLGATWMYNRGEEESKRIASRVAESRPDGVEEEDERG